MLRATGKASFRSRLDEAARLATRTGRQLAENRQTRALPGRRYRHRTVRAGKSDEARCHSILKPRKNPRLDGGLVRHAQQGAQVRPLNTSKSLLSPPRLGLIILLA